MSSERDGTACFKIKRKIVKDREKQAIIVD